jgi:hypothetical protein
MLYALLSDRQRRWTAIEKKKTGNLTKTDPSLHKNP